jgi:hypothetical protein
MVTIIVITRAQPFAFNRLYDTTKYAIPITIIIIPRIRGGAPRAVSLEASGELVLVCPISVEETDNSAKSNEGYPPIRKNIPPIIIRVAIIVTPIGLFVFVVKLKSKLLLNKIVY